MTGPARPNPMDASPMNDSPRKSPSWLIGVAWLIVALPLSWGLYQSILKSRPLFMGPPARTAPAK